MALSYSDCEIELGLDQRFGARGLRLLQFEVGPGVGQIPFGLMHVGLEEGRVQLRDDLVGLDQGIEVGEELDDVAGNLAPDLHIEHRDSTVPLAVTSLDHIAAGDGRSLILRRLGVILLEIHHPADHSAEHH